MSFQYLKSKQYYIDRYDIHTIEECLDWYWRMRKGMEKHREELKEKEPKTDFDKEVHKACSYLVNSIKGERYRHKNERINEWMEKDRKRQDFQDNTPVPKGIICQECGGKTEVLHRDLQESLDEKEMRLTFMFECLDCTKRQVKYEDGSDWDYEPPKCEKCSSKLETKYKKDKEKALLAEYREEFCLNDENGPSYLESMDGIIALVKSWKEREKKEKDPKFKKAKNLKILKVNQLKELIAKKAQKEKYSDLQFGKPEMAKYVIVDFTISDDNDAREEYHSRKDLKKLIDSALAKTNWRLMSDGISYRLGILSGRLKAYEQEDDLMSIV